MTNPLASPSIGLAVLTLRVLPGSPRIRVIPAGPFDAPRGAMGGSGPWNLTAAAAARIVALQPEHIGKTFSQDHRRLRQGQRSALTQLELATDKHARAKRLAGRGVHIGIDQGVARLSVDGGIED